MTIVKLKAKLAEEEDESEDLIIPDDTETTEEIPNKKRIGIVGYETSSGIGVSFAYLNFFRECFNAEVEIIFPLSRKIRDDLDLLVLPGGPDIDPARYSNYVHINTQRPDPIREWFDVNILPHYIAKKQPTFGICRGLQALAVHFQVPLIQDIPDSHETSPSDDRGKKVHKVACLDKNGGIFQQSVNSLHHQAVAVCPKNAIVAAWHDNAKNPRGYQEGDIIEALIFKDFPIVGIQWHAEEIWDPYAVNLVRHLLFGFDYKYYLRK